MPNFESASSPRFTRTAGIAIVTTALSLGIAAIATAHDMFVKPEKFRVSENSEVLVRLLNGTFSKSENSIARARVLDLAVVTPGGRTTLDTTTWNVAGDTSTMQVRTGGAGTYVIGVSTRTNIIALAAKEFNGYLASDGIPDVLAARRRAGELDRPARERYAKHVKALLQVGQARSDSYGTVLGYPAEVVPLENPYDLRVGSTLRVRAVVDGKPVANQFVQYGGRTARGARIEQRSVRTGADGVARFPLRQAGVWYIKFIHMTRLQNDPDADYESKWATATFDVR